MQTTRSSDIAYGRAPIAPLHEVLRATARWNTAKAASTASAAEHEDRRAAGASKPYIAGKHRNVAAELRADGVRYRLNAAECDTVRAEMLVQGERRAA